MQEYGELALALVAKNNLNLDYASLNQVQESSASDVFPEDKSDTVIWKKIKEGDKVAFGELYDRYVNILFSYGMYHSKDRGYVMDCIHDLFVDLYKYRTNLSKTDNVKYYLFKSLKRKINKKYNKKNAAISLDEFDYEIEVMNKRHSDSYEKKIITEEHVSERNKNLRNAMKTLSDKQRQILSLRFEEEKTYEEISGIIGVSVQSARTSIYRAIKALRKLNFLCLFLINYYLFN
ncbi:sigma-70 family RNA polymerase sigma factor [Formosa sediminum]|uniref:Sigma-70 family RNA polymerase sigma factor n=1 Tax=Formosa sediminum TaxID=2594004 RepID=A0A516GNR1_9FLAO|nr:sigma-70 family RNA polymerase sigma factor [Formosa sediminum]QDO93157.1 sigma-70 family RNA polymerase sigma factor [Formosa sediminum]